MEKAVARGLPVQLPHSMVSQVPIANPGRRCGKVCRRTNKGYLRVEAQRDRGTGGDERPRASGGERSAKSIDFRIDGVLERQDSHRSLPTLQAPEAETILGKSFLEPRLLRDEDRAGRGEDTTLRAIPGRQRAARRERARRSRPLLEAGPKPPPLAVDLYFPESLTFVRYFASRGAEQLQNSFLTLHRV